MFAVIDIESSGGNYKQDSIIEIAIIIHDGKKVTEEYSTLVNPKRPIQPFVKALTGISDEMVEDAPMFEEVAEKIIELTENRIIVAHNARFDYGFLRTEFKRIGHSFNRKHICTVSLSRHIFPHMPSYSLGNLCRDLSIPLNFRHRAYGDAAATTLLLEKLLFNDRKELIKAALKDELNKKNLPPLITREMVDMLPEEIGVYYFVNEKGTVIYVGKSKNIKERVLSHFSADLNNQKILEMKAEIADIQWEATGNELVALLMEADEIKRWMPKYNRAQRKTKLRYGIFVTPQPDGILDLKVKILNDVEQPLIKFPSKERATRILENILAQYDIQPSLKTIISKEVFNQRVNKVVELYTYPYKDFLLLEEGRGIHEKCVILFANGAYKGYGYFSPEIIGGNLEVLKSVVKKQTETPDIRKVILHHLRKNKKYLHIIPLND